MSFLMGGGMGGMSVQSALVRLGVSTGGMRNQVRAAMSDLRRDLNAGTRNLGTIDTGARHLEQGAQRMSAAAALLKGAAIGMGAALAGVVGMSIKAAVDWESAFAGVRKTMSDATEGELQTLEKQIRGMALDMPIAATQLAKLGEAAGALGVKTQDVKGFIEVAAMIGTTTNVSADEAATALGQLSNVLGMTQAEYPKFAAALVDLGNKGASTESQILEIASRAGGAASMIDLSTDALLAFASATANLGIEVEAGGTSLQRLFLDFGGFANSMGTLESMAKQAGMTVDQFRAIVMEGGKDLTILAQGLGMTNKELSGVVTKARGLDAAARYTGMSAKAFRDLFQERPDLAILRLMESLSQLDDAERAMAITTFGWSKEIRLNRLVMGLTTKDAKNLADSLQYGAEAWEAQTAAVDEAQERYKTSASQFGILRNHLMELAITFGTDLLPHMNAAVGWLTENIPAGLRTLGDIWSRYLEGPFTELWNAAVRVGEALGKILLDWGGGEGGGPNAIANTFSLLAGVVSVLAHYLTTVLDTLGSLLALPIVQELGKWAIILGAIVVSVKAMQAGIGALRSLGSTALRFFSFGKLGNPRPDQPLIGPAAPSAQDLAQNAVVTAQERAALMLQEAASALIAAARMLAMSGLGGSGGGFPWPGGSAPRSPGPMLPTGYPLLPGSSPIAIGPGRDVFTSGNPALAARQVGQSIIRSTADNLRSGLTSAWGNAKGMLSQGVEGAAKLFWPAMIADFALSLAAQPIGEYMRANTGMKRVADAWGRGWVEGLTATLQTLGGNDTFVGRRPIDIGNGRTMDPDTIRRMSEQVGNRQGSAEAVRPILDEEQAAREAGNTIDQAHAVFKLMAYIKGQIKELPKQAEWSPGSNTDEYTAWWDSVVAQVNLASDIGVITADEAGALIQRIARDHKVPTDGAELATYEKIRLNLRAALELEVNTTRERFREVMIESLTDIGFERGALFGLTDEDLLKIADTYRGDPEGKTPYATRYLAEGILEGRGIGIPKPGAGPTTAARMESFKGSLEEQVKGIQDLMAARDESVAKLEESNPERFGKALDFVDIYNRRIAQAAGEPIGEAGSDRRKKALIDLLVPKDLQVDDLRANWDWVMRLNTEMMTLAGKDQEDDIARAQAGIVKAGIDSGFSLPQSRQMLNDALGLGPATADQLASDLRTMIEDGVTQAMEQKGKKRAQAQQALLDWVNDMLPDELDFKDWGALKDASASDPALAAYFRGKLGSSFEEALKDLSNKEVKPSRLPTVIPPEAARKMGMLEAAEWWRGFKEKWEMTETPPPKKPPKELIQAVGESAAKTIWGSFREQWLTLNMPAPKLPETGLLTAKGVEIARQIADGMKSVPALGLIAGGVAGALQIITENLPGSPVKRGPMKHPFLPGAGRAIIAQIGAGMRAAAGELVVPAPGFAGSMALASAAPARPRPPAGLSLAGGGGAAQTHRAQTINVSEMYLLGPEDEESAAEMLSFMEGGG